MGVTWDDLTPFEREKYINQDCVSKGKFIPQIDTNSYESISFKSMWGAVNLEEDGALKKVIIDLYTDGKDAEEINYHVPCSLRYIHRVIDEHCEKREIMKQKIIDLYKNGMSKKDILIQVKCTRRYVNKVISGNKLN